MTGQASARAVSRSGAAAAGAAQTRAPAPWVPTYAGLICLALAWVLGMAWLSGCDRPWSCHADRWTDPAGNQALDAALPLP